MRLEVETRVGCLLDWLDGLPLPLWFCAAGLGAIGVLFVDSATMWTPQFRGQERMQAVALVAGAVLALGVAFLPRSWMLRLAGPAFVAGLILLVLVPIFGTRINGARRWLGFAGVTVQPTEFVKPLLVLVLARYFRHRSRAGFFSGVVAPLCLTFVPLYWIVRQPDLGSAMSLLTIPFAMAWVAGARARTLILLLAVGCVMAAAMYPFLHGYQRSRILVWLAGEAMSNNEKRLAGYQLWQSLVAVGSGSWTGSGLYEGLQNRYDFLPYRSTDFLFSVVAEETGWVGATFVVLAYTGFTLMILGYAAGIRDRFGRLLATGAATYFMTHLLIHVGVCTGLLPPTGLPLPLLSYGRSSVAGAWLAVGLVGHACLRRERNLGADRMW